MPRNTTTGVYTPSPSAVNPAVTKTKISSAAFNALRDDIASALNGVVLTQEQTTTAGERTQVRENIAAVGYDVQTLTTGQQTQALANIDAGAVTWTGAHTHGNRNDTNFVGIPQNIGSSMGPEGLGWIPFAATASYGYNRTVFPGTQPYIKSSRAFIVNTPGSGTFGPTAADMGIMTFLIKDNYLTSDIDGELDATCSYAYGGRKGDVGAYIGEAVKALSGTAADTGGVLGFEVRASNVNPSNVVQKAIHTLGAFIPGVADPVGLGAGFGTFNEVRTGNQYAAFHGSVLQEAGATANWSYLLVGTASRSIGAHYFRVVGDLAPGTTEPGDIIQGFTGVHKYLRTTSTGTFQIRNAADDTTLFQITDAGAISAAVSTGSGNLVFATSPTLSSPTLTTPVLGVATATSLNINGATLGTNALAVNGTASIGRQLDMSGAFPEWRITNSGANIDGGGQWRLVTGGSGSNGFLAWQSNTAVGGGFGTSVIPLVIRPASVEPGTTNAFTLGATGARWSNVFSVLGNYTGSVSVHSGTAVPAGGTAGAGLLLSSTANLGVFFGSGAPTLSAAQGSLYLRTDGAINARLYINTNGTTGWATFNTLT